MSFQDELKASYRTKEETLDESKLQIESEIYEKAKDTFYFIKTCLLNEAKKGNLFIENGTSKVSAFWQIPPEFLHHREETISPTYRKTFWGRSILLSPGSKQIIFSINKTKRYELFWEYLCQLAALEDIEIDEPVLVNDKTHQIFDFPYTLKGFYFFLDWKICVKSKVSISEDSKRKTVVTAKPILYKIDDNDTLLVNIVNSLSNNGFNSITANRCNNNQGITISCYYQGQEYSFVFRCHSSDLENETIQDSVLQVLTGIIIDEANTEIIKNKYITLFTTIGFNNISVNVYDNHTFFLKGHKNGVKNSFRLVYPQESINDTQMNGIDTDANTDSDVIDVINIDNMDGLHFEQFCAKLLLKNGFDSVEVTRGSGDQGIDIIAVKDGVKYGIQCKCYSSDIGNSAVQEAFSGKSFYKCHICAVLTNRFFTRSAVALAESNNVLLWDRKHLLRLISNAGMNFD